MPSVYTTDRFDRWFGALRDLSAKRRIQARIDRVEDGNFGDYKAIKDKVFEMRIQHGPGYRLYFTLRGLEVVILLAGGDKSTQTADIEMAIRAARQLEDRT
jgi:putative addiction module killer protein